MRHMALIDPKDAENIYNESGWAARRKEAREWRDAFTAKEILEAVDELPDDLSEEQPKYQSKAASLFMRAGLMRRILGRWAFRVTAEPHAISGYVNCRSCDYIGRRTLSGRDVVKALAYSASAACAATWPPARGLLPRRRNARSPGAWRA